MAAHARHETPSTATIGHWRRDRASTMLVSRRMYFAVFVVGWKLAVRLTDPGGIVHARLGDR
jgi:hypothetical protein